MKRILLIAFHFPPGAGFSGAKRTVAFARHLPERGWQPRVLTVDPRAYPGWRAGMGSEGVARLPPDLPVDRIRCLDAGRHLAIAGRYARLTALPDRWVWWWLGAFPRGLRLMRDWRPDLIWSTHPIATAHLIALSLHRWTGIPWIADFRDPFATPAPGDPLLAHALGGLARGVARHAARLVFATPAMARRMALESGRTAGLHVVENGVDEEAWPDDGPAPAGEGPLLLVHAGQLYPDTKERDPLPFLAALAELALENRLPGRGVRVLLRASGHDGLYGPAIAALGLGERVVLAPLLPERESLAEMGRAHGLLLFQGSRFNDQIPVKLYEYLYARRPLFALADAAGETARLLREAGLPPPLPLGETAAIKEGLATWLRELARGEAVAPDPGVARGFTRRQRTGELAAILDQVVGEK